VSKGGSQISTINLSAGLGIFPVEETTKSVVPLSPPGLDVLVTTAGNIPNIATHGNGSAYHPSIQKAFTNLFQPREEVKVNPLKPLIVLRSRTPNNASAKHTSQYTERPLPPLPTPKLTSTISRATDKVLPGMMEQELEDTRRPLTPMEKVEAEGGWFGRKPLEVRDGVAVTEEGVEGHFADLRIVGGEGIVTQV
jgi:hypothetical protein